MAHDVDTMTVSIETDGDADAVELPAGLVDLVAEDDQSPAETIGDVLMLSFASRAHHIVHHGEGASPELSAQEEHVMNRFEERFGMTFGEATGHQH